MRKYRFLIKSLIGGLLLLLIYAGLFQIKSPSWTDSNTQYRGQHIQLENWVYDTPRLDTLIVGSSLVATAGIYEHIPSTWYNLGLRGGGALTGLKVIHSCGPLPKVVVIETNQISRLTDDFMVRSTCSDKAQLLKSLPVFQEKCRPALVFQLFATKQLSKLNLPKVQALTLTDETQEKLRGELATHTEAGRYQDAAYTKKIFSELDPLIAYLLDNDVKILFIEFPVSEANTAGTLTFRKVLNEAYPTLPYFHPPEGEAYDMPDGSHMTFESSERFMNALTKWVSTH